MNARTRRIAERLVASRVMLGNVAAVLGAGVELHFRNMRSLSAYKVGWTEPGDDAALAYHGLGLAGEAGEVANEIKKGLRVCNAFARRDRLIDELGDVLYYWCHLAHQLGVPPAEIVQRHYLKLARLQAEQIERERKERRPVRRSKRTRAKGRTAQKAGRK